MKARLCSKWELWEIVEWRDDCVYNAINTGRFIWIPIEIKVRQFQQDGKDYLVVVPSDLDMPEYRKDWIQIPGSS